MRRGKNALVFVNKAISLIDIGQRILQWQLQNKTGSEQSSKVVKSENLKWEGTVADLVELAYGIIETKRISRDDIDISDFIDKLCSFFSIEVKDCYDTFRAIRRRVGSRTLFLDEMIEKLNERMDNMDNGIFKKKKNRK